MRAALERRGASVVGVPWQEPVARFEGFDAIVLRSNWDYHLDPDRFVTWLDGVEHAGGAVWNPPRLVRWNVSKRYLLDLAARGVPVVPTEILEPADGGVAQVMARRGWRRAVVKPAVAASAHGTRLIDAAEATSLDAEPRRSAVMVQPFVAEIQTSGEWSCVFIDGRFTHAMLKRPGPGDFRVQARFGGHAERLTPSPSVVEAAQRALAALPVAPLYARIDGVETDGQFVVMEAEVNEPGLFLVQAPEAAETFAEAIRRCAGYLPSSAVSAE